MCKQRFFIQYSLPLEISAALAVTIDPLPSHTSEQSPYPPSALTAK